MSKILICEEEENIRESLKLILSDFFELIIISDNALCVETLKGAADIELVLLDIKMLKTTQLQILKDIKAHFPKVNVIIVTGHKNADAATEAVRLGACGYIVKPFRCEEILSTIRKNVGKPQI